MHTAGNLSKGSLYIHEKHTKSFNFIGMLQVIAKGQAELKVAVKTINKSGGRKSSDEMNYSEIMVIGTMFPFSEYEPFKRFNTDQLEKDEKLVEKDKNYLLLVFFQKLSFRFHFYYFFLQKKYLATLGNDNGESFVRACLKKIMSDSLAIQFNLQGRRDKKSFIKLKIYKIIVGKFISKFQVFFCIVNC